jgi:hypothetical protein
MTLLLMTRLAERVWVQQNMISVHEARSKGVIKRLSIFENKREYLNELSAARMRYLF